ncbi:MAG TPA: hypothetical protein VFZ59_22725 [Verrucomicrobiae bacterium]|nr:hypothetical protein [Verrucomicrobiae bacterium]
MKRIVANSVVLLVAAGLGLVLGLVLRGKPRGDARAEVPADVIFSQNSERPASRDAGKRSLARVNDDSPLTTKLARDLSMSAGVTRWLYWLEAMEQASTSDYPRLIQLAEGNPAAIRLVSQRWIALYPRHAFDTLVAETKSGRPLSKGMRELSRSLFREWPKSDPEAAIAALSGPEDFAMRSSWRHDVGAAVIRNDAERGLRLFHDWNIENFGPHMDGVAKWASAAPRHAAEFAMANPAGFATQLAMETIGKEWAKTDPAGALEFAVSKPGEFNSILAASVLKEWSGRDLNAAANWLAAANASTRNSLSASFVESWAKQDANSALTWCEANLTGSGLAEAVGGVMKGAAERDVVAAAALVASLNPSSARAEAAAAVGKKWFPDRLGEDKPSDPAAVAWLAALDPESARRVVNEIQWTWGTCDPKGMAAFLASSDVQFSANPYSIVAREIARRNPVEGIEWASQLPGDRGVGAGADAFAEWRRSQPAAAMKWLNDLPPNDPRRQPYFEGAVRAMAWDAQTASQLAALSETERATARKVIEGMKLPEDRRASLIGMLGGR